MSKVLESKIQQEIVMWFKNNYCLKTMNPRCAIFSVPNEGKSAKEMMFKKATGLMAGASDLIVLMPNKCLFVECKNATGYQRPEQKEFQSIVEALGFEYHLVRSLEDFKKIC